MESSEHQPKKRRLLYIPWLSNEDDEFLEEGEDSWVSYLRRNISHGVGEEVPFPDSSWSYASTDSVFGEDKEEDKKSDNALREEALKVLYENEEVNASHIVVIVLNGVVCLLGKVSSESEIKKAGKIVEEIPGVWGVRNELEVEIN